MNDTTRMYFPPVAAGVALKNYLLSADNNNIIFNSALPSGAIVTAERRTRDGSGDYTAFSAGSTMRSTDLNNALDEVRFTAQEGRNKAFELEGQLDHDDITVGPGKGLTFEGSTIDGNETQLNVADPTADRTVTIPDQSGNVIVSGNATIVNADVSPNAEIAVSKLADGNTRQLLQTDSAGTGVEWTSNVDVPGTLDVTSTAAFDSNVTILTQTQRIDCVVEKDIVTVEVDYPTFPDDLKLHKIENLSGYIVDVGNPHFVIFDKGNLNFDIEKISTLSKSTEIFHLLFKTIVYFLMESILNIAMYSMKLLLKPVFTKEE